MTLLLCLAPIVDGSNTTCEMLPKDNSRYSEVIWTFPSHPSSVNRFRVVISGSQPCVSGKAFWFVRGQNRTGKPSECAVQETEYETSRSCALECRCLETSICGYLHYRVQLPSWISSTLALCYFELIYPGLVDPALRIFWCEWYVAVYLQTMSLTKSVHLPASHNVPSTL